MATMFADYIFKLILLNENVRISIKISLEFVPWGPIINIPALVQIIAWRWPGDKPLSEPMMVSLLTHIYVTRPKWVKMGIGKNSDILFHFFSFKHSRLICNICTWYSYIYMHRCIYVYGGMQALLRINCYQW